MRSGCPLNYGLEIFGDKWSLLVLRDMMFFDKRHFREFLKSEERISTNILTDRLHLLEREGLISKNSDSTHKQKIKYSLTEKSIDLVPVIAEIGWWSDKYAQDLVPGKQIILDKVKDTPTLRKFQQELRDNHIVLL